MCATQKVEDGSALEGDGQLVIVRLPVVRVDLIQEAVIERLGVHMTEHM